MWTLYEGDCLKIMPLLPDKSVHMILADLPYGTTSQGWDIPIPFNPLWKQYERLIVDDGVIVLFGTEPFSSLLRTSNLSLYRYDWFWVKNDATDCLNAKNKPMRKVEKVHVFSKGYYANRAKLKMRYFPQGLVPTHVKRPGNDYGATGGSFKPFRPSHHAYIQQFKNYPNELLYFPKDKEKYHPTQKPVALLEYLIKTYTNDEELILDNCAGSGSTGVAAENCNRNSILIEIEPQYCQIIKQRLTSSSSSNNTLRT